MDIFAFIDWTLKTYFLLNVTGIFLAIKKMMKTEDSKLIIAVSELLVVVIGAIVAGPHGPDGWSSTSETTRT